MIKKFEEYINEDYFSKLANRKDNGNVRRENEVTEDIVKNFVDKYHLDSIKSINIRKDGNKTIVDIDGDFVLTDIYTFEEIPFQFGKVTGDFNCSCTNLKSLNGCPEEVGGDFFCSYTDNILSLEGCPKIVAGNFYCNNCVKKFTIDEVKSLCDVKGRIFV